MVRSFHEEFAKLRRRLARRPPRDAARLCGSILTGTLFAPVLAELIGGLNEQTGSRLKVVAVENEYFGPEIVVAGLMTGSCVLASRGAIEGDFVILPQTAHKSDEPIMLDGMRLDELERQLGMPVHALDLEGFARMFAGG